MRLVTLLAWSWLVLISGCGARQTELGTNTNWLVACSDSSECLQGICACGVCTRSCDEARDCADVSGSVCVAAETRECDFGAQLCLRPEGADTVQEAGAFDSPTSSIDGATVTSVAPTGSEPAESRSETSATAASGDSSFGPVTPGDGGALSSPVAPSFCETWDRDLATETQWAMNAWGFERAGTIFEGHIEDVVDSTETSLVTARVAVGKTWFGWSQLEGHVVSVDIDPTWLEQLASDDVVFGVQRDYPLDSENGEPPRFDFVEAAIPAADLSLYPGRIGYHESSSDWIGVARLVEYDGVWQHFEVVETLHGAPVESFVFHFVEFDGIATPSPGPTEYLIAGTHEETIEPNYLRVHDFRVASDEARALVVEGLANPPEPFAVDRLGAGAQYRAGWSFARSSHVVSARTGGLAAECCTGAGGYYAAYTVDERLRGAEGVTAMARFFDGRPLQGSCGEQHLMGFAALSNVSDTELATAFTCDVTGDLPQNPEVVLSEPKVVLPATPENVSYVQAALDSAAPLYRLYNQDAEIDPATFPTDEQASMWAAPVDLMDGISGASQMIYLSSEEVIEREGWTEVHVATSFTGTASTSGELFHLKFGIPCGDARLKEVGSQWLAAVVDETRSGTNPDGVIEEGELFLVPGVLVPPYFGRWGQRF